MQKKFVVRFQRTPTAYTHREAIIVEAETPVAAILVMRDHLLRRGDNPNGFVPSVGFHLKLLAELRRDGVNHRDVANRISSKRTPEESLAWNLAYHEGKMAEEAAQYVEEYVQPPGRVLSVA